MKKMPCVYQRHFRGPNEADLLREVTPGCEWVLKGEGVPTRKWDGTACAVIKGVLYKRFDAKPGRTIPAGAIPCDPSPDPVTGHWPHWASLQPYDKYHFEAFAAETLLYDGTYELVGPKVNANPEGLDKHILIPHGKHIVEGLPKTLTWEGLQTFLEWTLIEGIVWHHPDGRMAKLRRKDYGFPWPGPRILQES